MKRVFNILFATILLSSIMTCTQDAKPADSLAHVADQSIRELLEKVFDAHGGLENWKSINSLKYRKSYQLFLEDSTIEKSANQFHHYNYRPETFIKIISEEGDAKKRLTLDNGKIQEMVDGTINLEASQTDLNNKLESSLFVIAQPFKLADEGTSLNYEGQRKTPNGNLAHVIKAVYDPTTNSKHTTADIWYLYFDANTYLMTGYMVQHKDHFSLINNLETTKVNGFTFPVKRESFRVSETGALLYLRATYAYQDFEVK